MRDLIEGELPALTLGKSGRAGRLHLNQFDPKNQRPVSPMKRALKRHPKSHCEHAMDRDDHNSGDQPDPHGHPCATWLGVTTILDLQR